jgi:hypothetical protein
MMPYMCLYAHGRKSDVQPPRLEPIWWIMQIMPRKTLALLAGAAAVLFGALAHQTARADDKINCSNLYTWNVNSHYKERDLVRYGEGSHRSEYSCQKSLCFGSGDEPGKGDAWKQIATCG